MRCFIIASKTTLLAVLLLLSPIVTHAAGTSINVSPASGTWTVGAPQTVNFVVASDVSIAGVVLKFSFSSNLAYTSVSTTGSAFGTEVSGLNVSGNSGTTTRLDTGTGYTGSSGKIISVTFTPQSVGTGTVTVDQSESEAADYDSGTNRLSSVTNGQFTIQAAPTSTPQPTTASGGSSTSSNNTATTSKSTAKPTVTPKPSASPTSTASPSPSPSPEVSTSPTVSPTVVPTLMPSVMPSIELVAAPSSSNRLIMRWLGSGFFMLGLLSLIYWIVATRRQRREQKQGASSSVSTATPPTDLPGV